MADDVQATQGETSANPETAGTPSASENSQANESKTMPDEAYKGLQRKLQREQQERERLSARLAELESQSNSGSISENEMDAVVQGMTSILEQHDPNGAQEIRARYNIWKANRQVQSVQQTAEQRAAAERAQVAEQEALSALREVARDFDIDPDSPLLDYGTPSDSFSARLATLRSSIKEAKRPVENPVTNEQPRNVADGSAHNTQQGTVQAPKTTEQVTKEMVETARNAYIKTPTVDNLNAWNNLREKYTANLLRQARS